MSEFEQFEVVVGINGTGSSLHAVKWAAAEAANRHGRLRIVHAWSARPDAPGQEGDVEDLTTSSEAVATRAVEVAVVFARTISPGLDVSGELVAGAPSLALSAAAQGASLVVLGDRSPGVRAGSILGALATAIAGTAPCPVVIVRGRAERFGPVVVAVDGSASDGSVLAAAFDRADLARTSVLAVYAVTDVANEPQKVANPLTLATRQSADRVLGDALASFAHSHPTVRVETHIASDLPTVALVRASAGAQLVVVGSPGASVALRALLSVSGELHLAQCPVEVIPAAA